MEAIKKVLSWVLIFIVINGILWGAQELYYYKDNKKLDVIEQEIDELDAKIKNIESKANIRGVTDSEYSDYSRIVDERNQLADEFNELAKKDSTRFYLIPIPLGKNRATK